MKYGLIGKKLSHSFSPAYFQKKFDDLQRSDCSYDLFELHDISNFPIWLDSMPDIAGVNVTVPYKEAIIPFIDVIDPIATSIGAINTIDFREGKSTGYNTDVTGFLLSIQDWLDEARQGKALVLGSGGSAKAILFALASQNVEAISISRSSSRGDISYRQLDERMMNEVRLIVHCTPLGMHPDVSSFPDIPYEKLGPQHMLFDLVYNPGKTVFLELGMKAGCRFRNGLDMLKLQADEAWRIWNAHT